MAQEKEPGASSIDDGASSRPPASMTSPPTDRKRTSLKEIAARASQSGTRVTTPSTAPPSVAPSRPATATPVPRPVEAGKDDSGVINLDVVHSSVTAQQAAAAEKAKPAQAGLFDDDKTVELATRPAEQSVSARGSSMVAPPSNPGGEVRPLKVAVVLAKKSNAGAIAGAAIALLGIAAAFAIIHKRQPDASGASPLVAEVRPAVTTGPGTPALPVAPLASAESTAAPSPDPAPTFRAGSDAKPADQGRVAVGPGAPVAPGAGVTSGVTSGKDAPVDPKLAAKSAPTAGLPGDLPSEMARAVGPSKDGDTIVTPIPEPAAGGPRNQNIPEQPSQGSVQAAVGAVMGGAKGCVAGADDISRAQVTFSSSGSVSSVSVTGWAAAHGKSGCVQAALKGAKVGPFSKSSFTVGVPIRP